MVSVNYIITCELVGVNCLEVCAAALADIAGVASEEPRQSQTPAASRQDKPFEFC